MALIWVCNHLVLVVLVVNHMRSGCRANSVRFRPTDLRLFRARDLLTIPGSIVNIIRGDLYDHSKRKKIFTLINEHNIRMSSKIYEENATSVIRIC